MREFHAALEGEVVALLAGGGSERATLLKRTHVREVWEFPSAECAGYFVKRYLSPGLGVGLRARLRGSKARREADTAVALVERGIATARVLAVGERRAGASFESVLVTEAVERRGDLSAALARGSGPLAERRRVLEALGVYLAELHRLGVDPPDLAGDNLLLAASAEPEFVLIDLDGVRVGRALSRRRRQRALLGLLHALRRIAGRADRLRVMRAYLVASGESDEESAWRVVFERDWRAAHRRALRAGTRRALRVGSRFDLDRDAARNLFWRKRFGRELAERALSAHDAGLGRELKRSANVLVTLQELDGGRRFVVKENLQRGLLTGLRNALVGSRARRAWVAGHALDFRGFATAPTVALEERKSFGLVQRSRVVTAYLEDEVPLMPTFRRRYGRHALEAHEVREKRALLRLVARTLARLHHERIHHHDLSARNLFIAEQGTPDELVILDLESVRLRPLMRRTRIRNLAQLLDTIGATHWSDRRRFLAFYGIRDPDERERWLRRIAGQSRERTRRRDERRRRRLRGADARSTP